MANLDFSAGLDVSIGTPPPPPPPALRPPPPRAPASAPTPKRPSVRSSTDGAVPDPVGELRFAVQVEGVQIGIFSECSGIQVEYEVMEYPEGGENRFIHKLRGRMKYPNLVLKRGITHEDALLKWFFETKQWDQRKGVIVALKGPDSNSVRTWSFAHAFPVKWAGPTLNAGSNNAATETLEIAHRGLVTANTKGEAG